MSRRKPSVAPPSNLHPVQFGQGAENRKRRSTEHTKHYKKGGNAR